MKSLVLNHAVSQVHPALKTVTSCIKNQGPKPHNVTTDTTSRIMEDEAQPLACETAQSDSARWQVKGQSTSLLFHQILQPGGAPRLTPSSFFLQSN